MFGIPLILITEKEVKYLRNVLRWVLIGAVALLMITLILPVFKNSTDVRLVCESAKMQLGQYHLFNSVQCLGVSFARLVVYAVLFYLAGIVAAALNGEHGWRALLTAIFTPDGNNAQMLTLLFITIYLLVTAVNVPYSTFVNYLVSTAFFISRNILTAAAFTFVGMRGLHWIGARELNMLEALLREQVTRYSDGLPYFMALMFFLSFYFWRIFGG